MMEIEVKLGDIELKGGGCVHNLKDVLFHYYTLT